MDFFGQIYRFLDRALAAAFPPLLATSLRLSFDIAAKPVFLPFFPVLLFLDRLELFIDILPSNGRKSPR